jgi:hypothetical protein
MTHPRQTTQRRNTQNLTNKPSTVRNLILIHQNSSNIFHARRSYVFASYRSSTVPSSTKRRRRCTHSHDFKLNLYCLKSGVGRFSQPNGIRTVTTTSENFIVTS